MAHVIDRRRNGGNESTVNRARFLRRYNEQIRRAVHDILAERSMKDVEQGGNVRVPRKDISEPVFRHGSGGDREIVSPGNRDFVKGDRIPRPQHGVGSGSQAGTGESEDDFVFALSRDEFLQIFFDDLELPRLERDVLLGSDEQKDRAGRLHDSRVAQQSGDRAHHAQRARPANRPADPDQAPARHGRRRAHARSGAESSGVRGDGAAPACRPAPAPSAEGPIPRRLRSALPKPDVPCQSPRREP